MLMSEIPSQHGLEVWRVTVQNFIYKSPPERALLESAALNPPNSSPHKDVEQAIAAWERAVDKYYRSVSFASPEICTESRMFNALYHYFTQDIQCKALWNGIDIATVRDLNECALEHKSQKSIAGPPTRMIMIVAKRFKLCWG